MRNRCFVAVIFIIIAMLLCGCNQQSVEISNASETAEYPKVPEEVQLSMDEKESLELVFQDEIFTKYDDIEDRYWYHSKGSSFRYMPTHFYMYLGKYDDSTYARLIAGFHRDDWIFFEKIIIKADDKRFEIPFDDYQKKTDVDDGVYERIDIPVDQELLDQLVTIVSAEEVKVRFSGDDKHLDYVVSTSQKYRLQLMLDYYNYLHGNYENLVERYVISEERIEPDPFTGSWKAVEIKDCYAIENDVTERYNIYRSYGNDETMKEIRSDNLLEYTSMNNCNTRIHNEYEMELVREEKYYSYSQENYYFEDDKLIIETHRYSRGNRKLEERIVFERISEDEFSKALSRVD